VGIILPDSVQAELDKEEFIERQGYLAKTLRGLLRDLDPNLDLVWVKEKAPAIDGLVPGRWHIRRRNQGAPDTYMPVVTADGGYMEPHAGLIEQLKQRDMWRVGDIKQHFLDQHSKNEAKKEKNANLKREQRRDNIAADYRAARRVPGESIYKRRAFTS
jgi:hypothetical protein